MLLPVLAIATAVSSAPIAADSSRWIVCNHGREAGDLVVVTRGDSAIVRFVFTDRNRGTRLEGRYRMDAKGNFIAGESRPVLADGSAGAPTDAFTVVGDSLKRGTVAMAIEKGAFVAGRSGTPWEQAKLVSWLLAQPNRTGKMFGNPNPVRAELVVDTTLRNGTKRQRARFVLLQTGNATPLGLWLDEKGSLLSGDVQWFITVRPDVVPLLPAFRAIELKYRAAQGEAMAAKAVTKTNGTVAITNGELFDSERGTMVAGQTVIVRDGRIAAVGPAASTTVPAGATVIDAAGKTIMPGMYEMHTHLQVSNQGALGLTQLMSGLTTARDLASDDDVAVSLRDRERQGKLAVPRTILAGFIEGPLKWAGPSAAVVATEAEARAWVARYDSLGYKQIKLYNVLHPDIVPTIAQEAHKRGMLLSGHIPRGLSMQAAVALGFDEVQHAAFFFSNWYQDSLYLPQMRAYSQVATAVAPSIDVNSPQMTGLVNYLRDHKTVIDGTFNLWIGGGGASVGAGGSTDQQKADSAYMNLIRKLYAGGVQLVAGTDNSSGSTYRRELEMYELAGIPRAKILQIATLDAARFMKEANDYGSVSVGKVADILVVGGKPMEKIGELQKIETVVRGGRLDKVSELQKLAFPRPGGGASAAEGMTTAWWLGGPDDDH